MDQKGKSMTGANTIGIVSDLHCGGTTGLMGPDTERGKQNIGQKYLWECWLHLGETWKELYGELDLLLFLGDLITGKGYRQAATGLVTAKLSEQAEIADECLEAFLSLTKPAKCARVEGTPYHESYEGVVGLLDRRWKINCLGVRADVEFAPGIVANIAHRMEGGSAIYKGTIMDREALWRTIAEARHHYAEASWLLRGHNHFVSQMQAHQKMVVVAPCWELQTKYAQMRGQHRWIPNLGGIMLVRDNQSRYGYLAREYDYPVPPSERTVVKYESL